VDKCHFEKTAMSITGEVCPFLEIPVSGFFANYFLDGKMAVQTTVWREVTSRSLGRKKNIAKSSSYKTFDNTDERLGG